jgi:N-acetylneuraminic acid mutarotase
MPKRWNIQKGPGQNKNLKTFYASFAIKLNDMISNTKRTKATITVLLSLSLILLIFHVPFVVATEDSWVSKAPMQVARSGLGVATVKGKIYAIGGSNKSGSEPSLSGYSSLFSTHNVDTNEEYDPAKDTWTFKKPMPTPRNRFAIAVYRNKIYCIGGNTKSGSTAVNEVYDTATDTWETKTSMPSAESWLTANVVGDKIYVMCPNGTNYAKGINYVYYPDSDSWDTKEPVPSLSNIGYATAVYENKIYVFGGLTENLHYSLTNIYNPETDTWSFGTPIPTTLICDVAVVTSGVLAPTHIYVLGTQDVTVYDIENDTWTLGSDIPTERYHFGVAIIDDIIYAIGGHTYKGILGIITPSAANEQYTPIGYIPEFPAWTILPLLLAASLAAVIGKQKLNKHHAY